jgi:hypothetical protein
MQKENRSTLLNACVAIFQLIAIYYCINLAICGNGMVLAIAKKHYFFRES